MATTILSNYQIASCTFQENLTFFLCFRDENAKVLFASLEDSNAQCLANQTNITALSILATGQIPKDLKPMAEAQVSVQSTGQ